MAVKPGAGTPRPAGSDLPAVVTGSTDVLAPIIVPNTLWQAADPLAYDGGQESDITHLREYEASGLGSRDDARWSGVLEVIPTKADYVPISSG